MRESHVGSFEVAHEMRDGKTWDRPETVDEPYDLVVVGGGISGLSRTLFFDFLPLELGNVRGFKTRFPVTIHNPPSARKAYTRVG